MLKRGLVAAATVPDSTSPRRGPLVTTSENTDDMRPRMWSGVTVWLIVERQTALTLSAAPATASSAGASHSELTAPGAAPRPRRAPQGAHAAGRGDRQAPRDDGPDDDQPDPAGAGEPAGRQ